jgi:hypothetical protein
MSLRSASRLADRGTAFFVPSSIWLQKASLLPYHTPSLFASEGLFLCMLLSLPLLLISPLASAFAFYAPGVCFRALRVGRTGFRFGSVRSVGYFLSGSDRLFFFSTGVLRFFLFHFFQAKYLQTDRGKAHSLTTRHGRHPHQFSLWAGFGLSEAQTHHSSITSYCVLTLVVMGLVYAISGVVARELAYSGNFVRFDS